MTSMSMMTATLLPSSARLPSTSGRRGTVVAKATSTAANQGDKGGGRLEMKQDEGSNGRREMIFGAAAAAVWSFANVAMGEEEPAKGTSEAKKKYAPICVTMPTARVCHK